MKNQILIVLALFTSQALADCGYLDEIEFNDLAARLVNRGPNMLVVYGNVVNNDSVDHELTAVSTPKAASSQFSEYRQVGGTGDITAHPLSSITLPRDGGTYYWVMGGNHITLAGFDNETAAKKLQFGTDFDPNQSVDITFTFSDGCSKTVDDVPIRDRMN